MSPELLLFSHTKNTSTVDKDAVQKYTLAAHHHYTESVLDHYLVQDFEADGKSASKS